MLLKYPSSEVSLYPDFHLRALSRNQYAFLQIFQLIFKIKQTNFKNLQLNLHPQTYSTHLACLSLLFLTLKYAYTNKDKILPGR